MTPAGQLARHEPVPPPPPECREQPVLCVGCREVRTMHTSAMCVDCGGWAERIPVTDIRSGDWICAGFTLTGREWARVTHVKTGPGWVMLETGERGSYRPYSHNDKVMYRAAETMGEAA